jgi:hypothetical protein
VAAPTLRGVGKHDRLYVRATGADLARWRRGAAAADAPSLSAFMRDLLNAQSEGSAETSVHSERSSKSRELWSSAEWERALALIASGGQRT